jgi:hypothetical protein
MLKFNAIDVHQPAAASRASAHARVQDTSPVTPMGPPKTVTVEDSFKGCPSIEAARRVVRVLAPDLLARLQEEHEVCCSSAVSAARKAHMCVSFFKCA